MISMYSSDQVTSLPISNQCLVFYALNLLDDMNDLQNVAVNVYITSESSIFLTKRNTFRVKIQSLCVINNATKGFICIYQYIFGYYGIRDIIIFKIDHRARYVIR